MRLKLVMIYMNNYKPIIIKLFLLVIILIVIFVLYWFALRPSFIKKECSWTISKTELIPPFAGITQEQADEMNKDCLLNQDNSSDVYKYFKCGEVKAQPPRSATPSKKIKRPSTDDEYKRCLRHHGL